LRDAAGWYDEKRAGLGDGFLTEFWSAMDAVTDRPLSFAITSTGLRACRLSRFPYVIHFRYDGDAILVFAVMFGGRDTSAWIVRV
jgi:hypothetical protein